MRKLLALTFIAMIFTSTAAAMPIQTNVAIGDGGCAWVWDWFYIVPTGTWDFRLVYKC